MRGEDKMDNGSIEKLPKTPAIDPASTPSHSKTTLVFVAGLFHGSWCWREHFVPFFQDQGYHCVAMDLSGHGKNLSKQQMNKYTINDYVEDVKSVVQILKDKVVVIGHSMGCAVVEHFVQRYSVSAAVLMSPPPPPGISAAINRQGKKIGRFTLLRAFLTKDAFMLAKNPKVVKKMFFTEDMPEQKFMTYFNQLENDSFAVLNEMRKPILNGEPNPQKVPIMLVGARNDGSFTRDEIDATGKLYGVEAVFFDGGHDLMLDENWKKAAEGINEWLTSEGF